MSWRPGRRPRAWASVGPFGAVIIGMFQALLWVAWLMAAMCVLMVQATVWFYVGLFRLGRAGWAAATRWRAQRRQRDAGRAWQPLSVRQPPR